MNEIFLLLLGFLGVFAVGCSIALLALGKMIDQFPTGDESKRTRSIASPIETTKISIAAFLGTFCHRRLGCPAGKPSRDDRGHHDALCHLSFPVHGS